MRGYDMYYDSETPNDYLEISLWQLGSASEATLMSRQAAAAAIDGCRVLQQHCLLVSRLPAINGIEVDTTTPESDGTYDHSVQGTKGSYVYGIDIWTHSPPVDPRVPVLARAQYQRLPA
jgi:hypothetical protein